MYVGFNCLKYKHTNDSVVLLATIYAKIDRVSQTNIRTHALHKKY